MISETLVSCGYLLVGCSWSIYRLIGYSSEKFSKVLPQFVIASIGAAAIGARSLHALIYNIFWRSYPIDPRIIVKELRKSQQNENLVDWILCRGGTASFLYSFYYHHNFRLTGLVLVVGLTTLEALLFVEDDFIDERINRSSIRRSWQRLSTIMRRESYPLAIFWILSHELFGWASGNNFCRLANVPYGITVWSFPPEKFYQGWSILCSINDYTMLCYVILMTEGLCK